MMTGLLRCIVVLLMAGLCHIAAEAGSRVAAKIDLSGRQAIKPLDSAHDQAPGTYRRGLRTSGSGIAGYLYCNEVEEASYTDYTGIYLNDNYVWAWCYPEITYEEAQTVLHYSAGSDGSYFYFQVENGDYRLEGIKIYLDKTRTNDAQVAATYFNAEDGNLYYTNTYVLTDYENGMIYWHPDSEYELDNLYFYLESGELQHGEHSRRFPSRRDCGCSPHIQSALMLVLWVDDGGNIGRGGQPDLLPHRWYCTANRRAI